VAALYFRHFQPFSQTLCSRYEKWAFQVATEALAVV
jgi:hypothetical protein